MKRIAVVENGVIVNIIIQDAGLECPPGVGIGWTYDGNNFSAPPPVHPNVAILNQIAALELKADTPRARREALLGNTSFLQSIESQIQALRSQLA